MFERIGRNIIQSAKENFLWTNVYGLSRTIMALSLAILLMFNQAEIFFRPAHGIPEFPQCGNASLFCMVPTDSFLYLNLMQWIVVLLLLIIASGWRPRITGIIHFYIAYSFHISAMTLDGGDQVHLVLTLLLLPITLTDSRKWHWESPQTPNIQSPRYMLAFTIAMGAYMIIRLQIAIIYLNGAFAKVSEEQWINGTAVYYFLSEPMLGIDGFMENLLMPILQTPFVVVPTWGTIILEFMLFAALIAPKKSWQGFFFLGILFHAGIAIVIGLYSFSFMMFAALILFLRPLEKEFDFHHLRISRMMLAPRFSHKWKLNKKGGETEQQYIKK